MNQKDDSRKEYRGNKNLDLFELEKMAKQSHNKQCLHSLVLAHYRNELLCQYVADNRYTLPETMDELAIHPNKQVRINIAKRSEKITNNKTLIKLALDPSIDVRRALAKTTKNEGIKRLLYKGNQGDDKIVGECLRRTSDMELIRGFILESPEERVKKFACYVLSNRNLSDLEIVKALLITCSKLSVNALPEILKEARASYRISEPVIKYITDYIENKKE